MRQMSEFISSYTILFYQILGLHLTLVLPLLCVSSECAIDLNLAVS